MSRFFGRIGLVAALCLTSVGAAIGLGAGAAPHRAAADTVVTTPQGSANNCSSKMPCIAAKNSGTGVGIQAVALKNSGANGATLSNLNSKKTIQGVTFGTTAGVAGYDNATVTNDLNQGVLGFSNNGFGVTGISTSANSLGGVGVAGYDLSANNPMAVGVYGYSGADVGVFGDGHTTKGIGVFGNAPDGGAGVFGIGKAANAVGVFGDATDASGVGVFGVGNASTGEGVSGIAPHGGFGVVGTSIGGNGVSGISDNFVGVGGQSTTWFGVVGNSQTGGGIFAETSSSSFEALRINANGGGPLIRASNSTKEVMSLDNAGNLIVTGKVTQFGTPTVATQNALGGRTIMYSPKQSVATVEDVGEGQLAAGQALVRIDPAFAATMDPRRPYLVFITPQGDSNGLYVTDKTPAGFVVREHSGRSSIAFDYRIVANPYASSEPRLPTYNSPLHSAPAPYAAITVPPGVARALQRLQNIRIIHVPHVR
jgi:hypothetical protein